MGGQQEAQEDEDERMGQEEQEEQEGSRKKGQHRDRRFDIFGSSSHQTRKCVVWGGGNSIEDQHNIVF
eukprot:9393540-Pyramimonas_sp.AAC.1